MDFMLALNVTIYGLGIVFLALLVLMVAIMILGKVFAVATGRELLPTPRAAPPAAPFAPSVMVVAAPAPGVAAPAPVTTPVSAPTEAAEPVSAPLPGKVLSVAVKVGDRVKRGDELCVIEAMKMGNSVKAPRDGYVANVLVVAGNTVAFGAPLVFLASSATAAAPAAPLAAPAVARPVPTGPSAFTLTAAGKTHAVELIPADAGAMTVVLDGARYDVRRDSGDPTKLLVNGRTHTADVKEVAGSAVTVAIDGTMHKLEMGRGERTARTFKLTSGGKPYKVEVTGGDGVASVALDGTAYRVERDKADPGLVLVNGQAHTVAVKESVGNAVTVVIDGRTERLEIVREADAAATPAAGATAPTPADPAAGGGTPVNAPLPGKVLSVAVKVGDRVKRGDELCVIEAMKMGNSVKAPRDGVVRAVAVAQGQTVPFGAPLVVLD